MRKEVVMTYVGYKRVRGYMGHYAMNYEVSDVRDKETNEILCNEYVFKESKIFKGLGLKFGDKVEMSINVGEDKKGKISLQYYRNVKKVSSDNE